jgi:hypothetical protein
LSRKDAARVGPISVADKEAILKKFAKPITKKDIGSALAWKAKYEAEHRMRLVLEAENKELLDQVAIAPDARSFAQYATRLVPGTELPAPQGVFPRWVAEEEGAAS